MKRRSYLAMLALAPLVAVVADCDRAGPPHRKRGSVHSDIVYAYEYLPRAGGRLSGHRPYRAAALLTVSPSCRPSCYRWVPAVMLANGNKNARQVFVGPEHPASPATRALGARILRSFA